MNALLAYFPLLLGFSVGAATLPATLNWEVLTNRGPASGGTVLAMDGRAVLKIENPNDEPRQVHLLTLQEPGIQKSYYVVAGEVKYESVRGTGYLEMWSCFPPSAPGQPESQYFSRTLGTAGRMGKLTGTSDWRPFELPFNRTGTKTPPVRLELNLHLEGRGTVYLSDLTLMEFERPAGASGGGWWPPKTSGLLGGIFGTIFGLWGALIGLLTSKGRYRRAVLLLARAAIGLGAVLAALGLAAWLSGQPFHVWSVLVLTGLMVAGIFSTNLGSIRRRIEEAELRRMTAIDTR
ncbi:MAG: hypothetical protein JNK85_05280 [Verrucomicrobiales bacterium]|nr:hypothetical protein [Verrucomicrobiales bacterium]